MKIVFFGTPEFAVASLDALVKNGYGIAAVVTAPDKPAGRGLEMAFSAVKEYAMNKGLTILQPENLKNEDFISGLKKMNPDLGVVVAFRKMPKEVWSLPSKGTFNLHASLLPQYRGAAPIHRAIMNSEKETGVTTFFLDDEIDTGKVIFRVKENIQEHDCAGDLYERLMKTGADLVLKTVCAIEARNYTAQDQSAFLKSGEKLKSAPKIFPEDCRIDWKKNTEEVYDFIRGLSPFPAARTEIKKGDETLSLKIFRAAKETSENGRAPGSIHTDGKTFLKLAAANGMIAVSELQLAGRKKMNTEEFLRGFSFDAWKITAS